MDLGNCIQLYNNHYPKQDREHFHDLEKSPHVTFWHFFALLPTPQKQPLTDF